MTLRYSYNPQSQEAADFDERCRRRLMEELGIDEQELDLILRLRQQVVNLQVQVRELEAELSTDRAERQIRIVHYRQSYSETAWREFAEEE
jgi:hypothetical protein